MTLAGTLDRRALFAGRAGSSDARGWRQIDGLAAGSGDVFWCGWSDAAGVFVAGDEGVVFHFDGEAWERMSTPASVPVHALWGGSRNALWAVGWMGLILRFDGAAWHRVRGCRVTKAGKYAADAENTPLFAIDGRDDGTAWAVGDRGTILRLDGETWVAEASGTRAHLRCVRCLSDGGVLAAGADGTVLRRGSDGAWVPQASPIGSTYVAALEVEPGTVLLAGGRYVVADNAFRGDLVLSQPNGIRVLHPDATVRRFRDLARTAQGVLAVGDGGQIHAVEADGLRRLASGSIHDLQGFVPLPRGEAMIVGDFGTVLVGEEGALSAFVPSVQTGDAAPRWSPVPSGTDRQLWGLWTDPVTVTAHACGEDGTVLVEDRGRWTALPPVGPLGIHALCRASDGGLLAAGQLGEIHHFDGAAWRKAFDLMMDVTILTLWTDGEGTIFATGDEGLILRGDGAQFARQSSGTRSALYGVWGPDAAHLLAVGDFGLVLRWNGRRWDEFNAGTEHFLFDVWGRGLDDIFVVGLSGTIGQFDGQRWRITPARARHDLLALSGTDRVVVAVGAGGAAMLHDGRHWRPDPTGTGAGLRAVTTSANGGFVAAGDGGTLLVRAPFADPAFAEEA